MIAISSLFLITLAFGAQSEVTNNDLVLPPPSSKADGLEEKLMVLIPGAGVSTGYYVDPMNTVQEMSNLRLWIVSPAFDTKLCIIECSEPSLCEPLNISINDVINQAVKAGYQGPKNEFFLAGHSLGGVCASTYTQAYNNTDTNILANIVYGSYVTDQNVGDWSVPVMTVGAELDGGLGRPGNLLHSIYSADASAHSNGGLYSETQMKEKPVIILEGMDHSDFCPGFHVPGDVFPSAISNKTISNNLIGSVTSSFLHLHTSQSDKTQESSLATIQYWAQWARENLLKPMTDAIDQLQGSVSGGPAPWCERAQIGLVGFTDQSDEERLFLNSIYEAESHPFENTRVHYSTVDTNHGYISTFNISGRDQYYSQSVVSDSASMCIYPAHEIGCKLASADRVAQQLHLEKGHYNDTLTCMQQNEMAYQTAIEYLKSTSAGRTAYARFEERGRPICFKPDYDAFGNIGPLWVSDVMTIKDSKDHKCLNVASLKLGPQPLDSMIFPGVHYCKLISPARIIDYMQIDSLKACSSCLNKACPGEEIEKLLWE